MGLNNFTTEYTDNLQFKHLPLSLIENRNVSRAIKTIAISNIYGLVFAIKRNNVSVYETKTLIQMVPSVPKEELLPLEKAFISIGQEIVALDINWNNTLFIVLTNINQLFLFDVKQIAIWHQPNIEIPSIAMMELSKPSLKLIDLFWNPCSDTLLIIFNCSLHYVQFIFNEAGTNIVKVVNEVLFKENVTSICWSPKGKQALVGTKDGIINQIKIENYAAIVVKEINSPQVGLIPYKILWHGTREIFGVYKHCDNFDMIFASIYLNKETQIPEFALFHSPFYDSRGDNSSLTGDWKCVWLFQIPHWNNLLFAISNYDNIVVTLLKNSQGKWVLLELEDGCNATLPVAKIHQSGDDNLEMFPNGVVLDLTTNLEILFPRDIKYPPGPTILIMTEVGYIVPFSIVSLWPECQTSQLGSVIAHNSQTGPQLVEQLKNSHYKPIKCDFLQKDVVNSIIVPSMSQDFALKTVTYSNNNIYNGGLNKNGITSIITGTSNTDSSQFQSKNTNIPNINFGSSTSNELHNNKNYNNKYSKIDNLFTITGAKPSSAFISQSASEHNQIQSIACTSLSITTLSTTNTTMPNLSEKSNSGPSLTLINSKSSSNTGSMIVSTISQANNTKIESHKPDKIEMEAKMKQMALTLKSWASSTDNIPFNSPSSIKEYLEAQSKWENKLMQAFKDVQNEIMFLDHDLVVHGKQQLLDIFLEIENLIEAFEENKTLLKSNTKNFESGIAKKFVLNDKNGCNPASAFYKPTHPECYSKSMRDVTRLDARATELDEKITQTRATIMYKLTEIKYKNDELLNRLKISPTAAVIHILRNHGKIIDNLTRAINVAEKFKPTTTKAKQTKLQTIDIANKYRLVNHFKTSNNKNYGSDDSPVVMSPPTSTLTSRDAFINNLLSGMFATEELDLPANQKLSFKNWSQPSEMNIQHFKFKEPIEWFAQIPSSGGSINKIDKKIDERDISLSKILAPLAKAKSLLGTTNKASQSISCLNRLNLSSTISNINALPVTDSNIQIPNEIKSNDIDSKANPVSQNKNLIQTSKSLTNANISSPILKSLNFNANNTSSVQLPLPCLPKPSFLPAKSQSINNNDLSNINHVTTQISKIPQSNFKLQLDTQPINNNNNNLKNNQIPATKQTTKIPLPNFKFTHDKQHAPFSAISSKDEQKNTSFFDLATPGGGEEISFLSPFDDIKGIAETSMPLFDNDGTLIQDITPPNKDEILFNISHKPKPTTSSTINSSLQSALPLQSTDKTTNQFLNNIPNTMATIPTFTFGEKLTSSSSSNNKSPFNFVTGLTFTSTNNIGSTSTLTAPITFNFATKGEASSDNSNAINKAPLAPTSKSQNLLDFSFGLPITPSNSNDNASSLALDKAKPSSTFAFNLGSIEAATTFNTTNTLSITSATTNSTDPFNFRLAFSNTENTSSALSVADNPPKSNNFSFASLGLNLSVPSTTNTSHSAGGFVNLLASGHSSGNSISQSIFGSSIVNTTSNDLRSQSITTASTLIFGSTMPTSTAFTSIFKSISFDTTSSSVCRPPFSLNSSAATSFNFGGICVNNTAAISSNLATASNTSTIAAINSLGTFNFGTSSTLFSGSSFAVTTNSLSIANSSTSITTPIISAPSNFMFAANQQPPLFGNATAALTTTTSAFELGGNKTNNAASAIFGGNAVGSSLNIFGQPKATTDTQSIFGGNASFGVPTGPITFPFGASSFGGTTSFNAPHASVTTSSSMFAINSVPLQTPSIFGAPVGGEGTTNVVFGSAPQFGSFGGTGFGSNSTLPPAPFGTSAVTTTTPILTTGTTDIFGRFAAFGSKPTASGAIGQTAAPVFGSAFGVQQPVFGTALPQPQQQQSTGSIFGTGSQFGSTSTGTFGFGALANAAPTVFGAPPAFGTFGSPSGPKIDAPSIFGSPAAPPQSFGFGGFGLAGSVFGPSAPAPFGASASVPFGASASVPFGASASVPFGAPATFVAQAPSLFSNPPTNIFGSTQPIVTTLGAPSSNLTMNESFMAYR